MSYFYFRVIFFNSIEFELFTNLPSGLLRLCTSEQTFTSQAVGSEASAATLNTGKILSVFAGTSAQYEARKIPSRLKHEANASTSMSYATATDQVYYIQNNYLNLFSAISIMDNFDFFIVCQKLSPGIYNNTTIKNFAK